jgi:hypothetical protein
VLTDLHARFSAEVSATDLRGAWDDVRFDALAQALFAHQYAGCTPYRRLADGRGIDPASIRSHRDVPAVPTDSFRLLDLATFPAKQTTVTFLTSGTTSGARGRHLLRTTASYAASARPWLDLHLPSSSPRLFAFMPSPQDDPHSSLSWMVGDTIRRRGEGPSGFLWGERGPDVEALVRAADAGPLVLLATARALQHALDSRPSLPLPPGSVVMETGGFKGAAIDRPRDDFYADMQAFFGIPADAIVGEYGMTELGSQGWHPGLRIRTEPRLAAALGALPANTRDPWGVPRVLMFPPWCRVGAVDPDTLALRPDGEAGLLRFWDLANVDSIACVQTADVGTVLPGGAVLLHGRAPGATPRGCSLAVDELLRGVT